MTPQNSFKKPFSWQTKEQKYVHENPYFKVRQDEVIQPNGESGRYLVVEKKDFVLVIPKIKDKFYLVEQDRYAVDARSLEFPKGSVEKDEGQEDAACRELAEETGIFDAKLTFLGRLWLAPGHHTQKFDVYLAENGKLGQTKLDPTEADMEVINLTETELIRKISNGSIKDSDSLSAFALYQAMYSQKNIG